MLLDTGIVPMREPGTRLVLEAPGGLVEVRAACAGGKAERVAVTNVASFVDRLGATIEVEGVGTLGVDTAFGGDGFVVADASALGFPLVADEARDLSRRVPPDGHVARRRARPSGAPPAPSTRASPCSSAATRNVSSVAIRLRLRPPCQSRRGQLAPCRPVTRPDVDRLASRRIAPMPKHAASATVAAAVAAVAANPWPAYTRPNASVPIEPAR